MSTADADKKDEALREEAMRWAGECQTPPLLPITIVHYCSVFFAVVLSILYILWRLLYFVSWSAKQLYLATRAQLLRIRRSFRAWRRGTATSARNTNGQAQLLPIGLQVTPVISCRQRSETGVKCESKTARLEGFCTICQTKADVQRTRCGHVFHTPCLGQWLDTAGADDEATCPICRTKLQKVSNSANAIAAQIAGTSSAL